MARTPKAEATLAEQAFAGLAREFCRLIETRKRRSARSLLRRAHRLLAKLYASALELAPRPEKSNSPETNCSFDEWKRIYADLKDQFGSLGRYCEIFNPYEHTDEPIHSSLSNDLADVYCDLKAGTRLWDLGFRDAAINAWIVHFRLHWFWHASAAIRALGWLEFHYGMARSVEDLDELLKDQKPLPKEIQERANSARRLTA